MDVGKGLAAWGDVRGNAMEAVMEAVMESQSNAADEICTGQKVTLQLFFSFNRMLL